MKITSAERLRSAREAAGFNSAAEAARARGWKEATYRHHENGTRAYGMDHARSYARAFNVSLGWLLGIEAARKPNSVEASINVFEDTDGPAQVYYEADAEIRRISEQTFVGHFDIDEFDVAVRSLPYKFNTEKSGPDAKAFDVNLVESLSNVEDRLLFSFYAVDEAMAPTIRKGALVLADAGHREFNVQDVVWVVSIGGIASVRRIRSLPGSDVFQIYADNDTVPPMTVKRNDMDIRGRVLWVGQDI